jgi:CRP-like cAMP-binding protein
MDSATDVGGDTLRTSGEFGPDDHARRPASNGPSSFPEPAASSRTTASTFDGASVVQYQPKDCIYQQGDLADTVFLVQEGRVKLTASTSGGKEGLLGLLSRGSFLGEGCLGEQSRRVNTATAFTRSTLVRVQRETMMSALRFDSALATAFMLHLLERQQRIEEDLLDRLLNCSEKRLARALLSLAGIAQPLEPDVSIPHVTQEALAEMAGTTRSRVSFFMNRFRLRGLVDYDRNNTLTVRHLLLTIVLDDMPVRR